MLNLVLSCCRRILLLRAYSSFSGTRNICQLQSKHFFRRLSTSKKLTEEVDPQKLSRPSALNFDTLGSWNHRLDLDLNMEQSIKRGTLIPEIDISNVGQISLLGRRKENEDRLVVSELDNHLLLFAIFDGHAGSAAADYASTHFEVHIKYWLERGEKNLQKILSKTFVEVNNSFSRHLYYNHIGNEQAMNSGTTATVCLLRNSNELVVGHVGDSKAMVCRKGKVVRLTRDHKPSDIREKERIKSMGGNITRSSVGGNYRVSGKLDMTRSIGDVELKAIGVTAEPDVRSFEVRHGKDAFLVLTTDGISYVMNDQEVINHIATCKTASEAAGNIADQALHFGSEDNCSAIVVPFGAWGKYADSEGTVQFSFGRNIISSRYN